MESLCFHLCIALCVVTESEVTPSRSLLCYCNESHDQKQLGSGGEGLFHLILPDHHPSVREVRQEPWGMLPTDLLLISAPQLPSHGTAQSGLRLPLSASRQGSTHRHGCRLVQWRQFPSETLDDSGLCPGWQLQPTRRIFLCLLLWALCFCQGSNCKNVSILALYPKTSFLTLLSTVCDWSVLAGVQVWRWLSWCLLSVDRVVFFCLSVCLFFLFRWSP